MKYTLNFSLKLDRDDHHCIVYDKGGFTENPIAISIPEIVKALEHFIKVFEEVGVIEEPSSKNGSAHTKKKANEGDIAQEESVDSMQTTKSNVLKGISGKAYIRQSKELNEKALEKICSDLTSYFQECCSKISTGNFLSDDKNLYISGIKEAIEIRNYLAKYTGSKKESYQNGYLYISAL